MEEMLYVHFDNISNAVLTRGISHEDFIQGLPRPPKNLLLLTPDVAEGEYERHTGLKMFQGEEAVKEYLESLKRRRPVPIKWIDFASMEMIWQLTPIEISELLYFGHMRTHLHSPFFYKLQNNFAYFEIAPEVTKVYYRHTSDFYSVLGNKLRRNLLERLNEKKGFFKRATPVAAIPDELLEDLKPLLQEGVVFHFAVGNESNVRSVIPLYLAEDRYRTIETTAFTADQLLATLVYDTKAQQWFLEKKEDFEEWPFRHPVYN